MPERLMTVDEVAERLRTPVATLRYWRHIRKGPPSAAVGRRVLYREADVELWLAAQFEVDRPPAA